MIKIQSEINKIYKTIFGHNFSVLFYFDLSNTVSFAELVSMVSRCACCNLIAVGIFTNSVSTSIQNLSNFEERISIGCLVVKREQSEGQTYPPPLYYIGTRLQPQKQTSQYCIQSYMQKGDHFIIYVSKCTIFNSANIS